MRREFSHGMGKEKKNSGKANVYSVLHLQNANSVDFPVLII